MGNYYNNLNKEVKEYFSILSSEFPTWLFEYINTPEMLRLSKISNSCGTDYSKCFKFKYFYSVLDHSVGVALIIWNFTHDKRQTLSGLFHDIATPVFKHCIDYMNGDTERQESTEERTTDTIRNSKEIMKLLNRDGIRLEEVDNYKMYPIADNDTPKLSADRLEYSFSSGMSKYGVYEDLDIIRKIYNDIVVVKNEDGIDEMSFNNIGICEEFIFIISKLWSMWISDDDKTVMQFIADICKMMNELGYLTVDDLYLLSEEAVINKILTCPDEYIRENFKKFLNIDKSFKSDSCIAGNYCINIKSKMRYINPLVQTEYGIDRIMKISSEVNRKINNFLNTPNGGYYTCFDIDFNPNVIGRKRIYKNKKIF